MKNRLYLYENKAHPEPDMSLRVLEKMLDAAITLAEKDAVRPLKTIRKQLSLVSVQFHWLLKKAEQETEQEELQLFWVEGEKRD